MKRFVLIVMAVLMISMSGCIFVTQEHPRRRGPKGKVIVITRGNGHHHHHHHHKHGRW